MTQTKKATTRKTRVKLPPNPFIHEVLALVDKQRTKAKKIEILEEYSSDALKSILIWNFDQTVVSMIPEGAVPYNKNEVPVGTIWTAIAGPYGVNAKKYNFGTERSWNVKRGANVILLNLLHQLESEHKKIK